MIEIRKFHRADGVVVRVGLPGDSKAVGAGVFELRIREGKGYRVYFAREGATVVVLLCAGEESAQSGDIERAKSYWREYRRQA